MSDEPLLTVRGLTKHYPITEGLLQREIGRVRAVDGISFDIYPGETFGLIGETGCGKSTAAETLLRLEEPTDGVVVFDGEYVTSYGDQALKRFRRRAQMIFQDPTSSFDPRMRIGESIAEPLVAHGLTDADRRRSIVDAMLERVGLGADVSDRYPHELSGGQKQRAGLARALVVNPDLLVADEPVSALDVSVQAEILSLLAELQDEFELSILFITHDMNVVREVCDRIAVMYLGEIVEIGPTESLLDAPQHPYTRALVASIPSLDPESPGREVMLSGDVPDPSDPPSGCRFHTRCPEVIPPSEYDLEPAEWGGVWALRRALAEGRFELVRPAGGQGATAGAAVLAEGEQPPDAASVRKAFELPERLSDDDAEDALAAALTPLLEGDRNAAIAQLQAGFETACSLEPPALQETDAGHPAACHRHDGSRG